MKYFSMFSGIGGFEYGIGELGECIGYSEIDKYAKEIYRRHYPDHTNYGDATQISIGELPNFDLLVGGFPCQSFSISGRRCGFDDTRGTLFFEIIRILKDKRPRYFILENVPGLLSNQSGETFQTILGLLTDIGYNVEWQILDSKDFQVGQSRKRIYIIGHLGGKPGWKILPFTQTSSKVLNQIGWVGKDSEATRVYDTTLARTIKFGGGMGAKTGLYIRDGDDRSSRLTPLECERAQGFPDYWTKWGGDGQEISDNQRYKCLGNAVTTTVIKAIMERLIKVEKLRKEKIRISQLQKGMQ